MFLLGWVVLLVGCSALSAHSPVPLGEESICGSLTYRVTGCSWSHSLDVEGRKVVPTHSFLMVRLELTNSGAADLPAGWLPDLRLVDEHLEHFAASVVSAALPGTLRGSPAAWKPLERLSGTLVYDVPQALYWLQAAGCPPLDLACWWPERIGD